MVFATPLVVKSQLLSSTSRTFGTRLVHVLREPALVPVALQPVLVLLEGTHRPPFLAHKQRNVLSGDTLCRVLGLIRSPSYLVFLLIYELWFTCVYIYIYTYMYIYIYYVFMYVIGEKFGYNSV